jgi:uncharacterized protein YneF (UPF0154 family)
MGIIIELRQLGVKLTRFTSQKLIDKYLKDYPELKDKLKNDGREKDKPKKGT